MDHLYKPHNKRQRKCRLITRVPITFSEPAEPTRDYVVAHRHPTMQTRDGHEFSPTRMASLATHSRDR